MSSDAGVSVVLTQSGGGKDEDDGEDDKVPSRQPRGLHPRLDCKPPRPLGLPRENVKGEVQGEVGL